MKFSLVAALLAAVVCVIACGSSSTSSNGSLVAPDNPTPVALVLSPFHATAGGSSFTLTVDGSDFASGAIVQWNGSDRTTTTASSTQLTADIDAGDIAVPGFAVVTVLNPGPGGGVSTALPFFVFKSAPLSRFAYAHGQNSNSVAGFAVDPDSGALTAMPDSPFVIAQGASLGMMATHPNGRLLYVANGDGGGIFGFAIDEISGMPSPIPGSPFYPEMSFDNDMLMDLAGRFLFTTSLVSGTSTEISVFQIDASTGVLTLAPGSPLTLNVYASSLSEDSRGTMLYAGGFAPPFGSDTGIIIGLSIDSVAGTIAEGFRVPVAPLKMDLACPSYSFLATEPSGQALFVACFTASPHYKLFSWFIDPLAPTLSVAQMPQTSRSDLAVITPSGKFGYGVDSTFSTMTGFELDPTTGSLGEIAMPDFQGNPLAVDESGRFVYAAPRNSGGIAGFSIDPATGYATPLSGSPFSGLDSPYTMVLVPAQ